MVIKMSELYYAMLGFIGEKDGYDLEKCYEIMARDLAEMHAMHHGMNGDEWEHHKDEFNTLFKDIRESCQVKFNK